MSEFYIRNKEVAKQIVEAFKQCGRCDNCILNSPEGWYCSYLYDQAVKYLENH